MNRLRFWVFVLALWLIVLAANASLLVPATVRTGLMGFVVLALVLPVFFPSREMWPKWVLLAGLIAIYVVLQVYRNGGINPEREAATMTALAVAVITTGFIASRIGAGLQIIEEAISEIALGDTIDTPTSFSDAQGIMYRELQRARYFERPLSVVIASVDAESMNAAVPRMTQEVREILVRKFIMTRIAEVLDENLPQFDPVALRDNSFIAILPEATPAEADAIAQSIGEAVQSRLGIALCLGTASLPTDAQTFEELVDAAEARSNRRPPSPGTGESERQRVRAYDGDRDHQNGMSHKDAPARGDDEADAPTHEQALKPTLSSEILSGD